MRGRHAPLGSGVPHGLAHPLAEVPIPVARGGGARGGVPLLGPGEEVRVYGPGTQNMAGDVGRLLRDQLPVQGLHHRQAAVLPDAVRTETGHDPSHRGRGDKRTWLLWQDLWNLVVQSAPTAGHEVFRSSVFRVPTSIMLLCASPIIMCFRMPSWTGRFGATFYEPCHIRYDL